MPVSLKDLIFAQPAPAEQHLPFIHTTKSKSFLSILRQDAPKLEPAVCPPIDEARVYTFYGRPAYRVPREADELKDDDLLASCFFFRPEALTVPTSLYAFATGAYNRYKKALAGIVDLSEFKIHSDRIEATKLAILFFGSERGYFDGEMPAGINADGF